MNGTPPDNDLPDNIGRPARNALANVGIHRLEQLTEFSETEIKQLHGVGPKAVGILRSTLAAHGLSFADEPSQKRERFPFPPDPV